MTRTKANRILIKLCNMIIKGQHKNSKKFGLVAACIIDPFGSMVAKTSQSHGDTWAHAERVAISAYKDKYGEIPANSIIITTLSPCNEKHDKTAKERFGSSCTDLINDLGIRNVYCGYIDPTQNNEHNSFTCYETNNTELKQVCQKISNLFLT